MRRRDFFTALAALVSQATLAQAQTYPSRPVHLIVGDVARVIGKRLSERFGVPFVVENMVARLANLGAAVLAKSPAGSATFIDEETEKWRKVVRFSGAKSN